MTLSEKYKVASYRCVHGGCELFGKVVKRVEGQTPCTSEPDSAPTTALQYCKQCLYVLEFVPQKEK
jgi:hypothetical protein